MNVLAHASVILLASEEAMDEDDGSTEFALWLCFCWLMKVVGKGQAACAACGEEASIERRGG